MSNFSASHTGSPIESFNVDFRLATERAYVADPKRTHSELVSRGLWYVAAQLKIDYEAGRL